MGENLFGGNDKDDHAVDRVFLITKMTMLLIEYSYDKDDYAVD